MKNKFLVLAITALVSYIISILLNRPARQHHSSVRRFAIFIFIWTCCMISYATVFWDMSGFSLHPDHHILNLKPLFWLDSVKVLGYNSFFEQMLLNILMFVPFGLLLPIVSRKACGFFGTAGISLVLTVAIEIFQYFTGRSCDIDDVAANLLGGIIGYIIFSILNKIFKNQAWWNKLCDK